MSVYRVVEGISGICGMRALPLFQNAK